MGLAGSVRRGRGGLRASFEPVSTGRGPVVTDDSQRDEDEGADVRLFADKAHLTRQVRERVGVTPAAYARTTARGLSG